MREVKDALDKKIFNEVYDDIVDSEKVLTTREWTNILCDRGFYNDEFIKMVAYSTLCRRTRDMLREVKSQNGIRDLHNLRIKDVDTGKTKRIWKQLKLMNLQERQQKIDDYLSSAKIDYRNAEEIHIDSIMKGMQTVFDWENANPRNNYQNEEEFD